jgi:hypothetical protein
MEFMKLTRRQLRQIIEEVIIVHQVPVDLDIVDSEEAYGIGYMKGAEQDPDINDDGFLSVAELINMTHDIVDDIEAVDDEDDQMSASWQQILGNCLDENNNKRNNILIKRRTHSLKDTPGSIMTNKTTEQQIREHVRATISEIKGGNKNNTLSDTDQLSEARAHVRGVISEIMVGLTPIRHMDTQVPAKKAYKGDDTDTAVDKAALGFNTFDMQEWASIAGIDEKYLNEDLEDDMGNSSMLGGGDAPFDNVVDIGDDEYDTADEIPGMEVSPVSGDSDWDDDLEDEVEDLADEYAFNQADPDVFDIRDFLAEVRKR